MYNDHLNFAVQHISILPPQERIELVHEYAKLLYKEYYATLAEEWARLAMVEAITNEIFEGCQAARKEELKVA